MGAPVEFHSARDIRKRYGPAGIRDFDVAYEIPGAVTDDTQMTLFTAEGLIRAWLRGATRAGGAARIRVRMPAKKERMRQDGTGRLRELRPPRGPMPRDTA